jgi:hypothetical protein
MASRLGEKARKRKMTEEEQAAQEGSVRRREAVREQVQAKPKVAKERKKPISTENVAESAPVSLSDTLKESLNKGSTYSEPTPRTSVLDPPKEVKLPESIAANTTYNPETGQAKTEVRTGNDVGRDIVGIPSTTPTATIPRETVPPAPATATLPDVPMIQKYEYVYDPITKTRTKKLVSKPATVSAAQAQQVEQAAKNSVVKLSTESQEQYETRLANVIDQNKKLALGGITSQQRSEAIATNAANINEANKKAIEDQAKTEKAYFDDPWVKERLAKKAAFERENEIFNPILNGLTWVADNVASEVMPLAGPLGGIMAQAYKAFAPPTSKFYENNNFDDKVVNFLASNVQDKAQDLLLGQLKNTAKFAGNLAKGYRRVDTKGGGLAGGLTGNLSVQEAGSKITGGNMYTPGVGNIRGNIGASARADFGDVRVGPLPATRPAQAPQRLVAPRTDVLLSPRGARGPIARPVRGVARPVART